jgi:transposase
MRLAATGSGSRWLRARDVEAYVIHPTSIAVSREHRRATTDRLDTEGYANLSLCTPDATTPNGVPLFDDH